MSLAEEMEVALNRFHLARFQIIVLLGERLQQINLSTGPIVVPMMKKTI